MSLVEDVFGPASGTVSRYVDILASTGVEWGLIGPREVDRLWDRHIYNSAAVTDLLPDGTSVVDVGSGAGLPGIPVALRRPDLRVTLLEPLLRRATFLSQTVDELGLADRVAVARGRAEEHHETYDAVLARAVAPLDRLVSWCDPLRSPTGSILAMKGRSAADEVAAAGRAMADRRLRAEVLAVRAHPSTDPTTVVRLRSA